MSVLRTLRTTVAPELNHLYTVPPFIAGDGGMDCGWYCREHALHTFFVAGLLGADADIRTGDFSVESPVVPRLTSLGDTADHSWCSVGGVVPVDLSMTFANFGEGPQLAAAIIGEGANGAWCITYAEHESVLQHHNSSRNVIFFIERKVEPHDAESLLGNPYLFIFPPRAGDTASWHVLYGQDIYAKISWHCYLLAKGEAKNTRSRLDPNAAVRWISAAYPDARAGVAQRLGSA